MQSKECFLWLLLTYYSTSVHQELASVIQTADFVPTCSGVAMILPVTCKDGGLHPPRRAAVLLLFLLLFFQHSPKVLHVPLPLVGGAGFGGDEGRHLFLSLWFDQRSLWGLEEPETAGKRLSFASMFHRSYSSWANRILFSCRIRLLNGGTSTSQNWN